MLHYLEVGGPILWLLSIISVLTLSIILERIVFFTKNEKDLGKKFKIEINKLIREDKINDAISLCKTKKLNYIVEETTSKEAYKKYLENFN